MKGEERKESADVVSAVREGAKEHELEARRHEEGKAPR